MTESNLPNSFEFTGQEKALAAATAEFVKGPFTDETAAKLIAYTENLDPAVAVFVMKTNGLNLDFMLENNIDELRPMTEFLDKANSVFDERYPFLRLNKKFDSRTLIEVTNSYARRQDRELKASLEASDDLDDPMLLEVLDSNKDRRFPRKLKKAEKKEGCFPLARARSMVVVGKKFSERVHDFAPRDVQPDGEIKVRQVIHFGVDSDPMAYLNAVAQIVNPRHTRLMGLRVEKVIFDNPAHEKDLYIQQAFQYVLKKQDGKVNYNKPSKHARNRKRKLRSL